MEEANEPISLGYGEARQRSDSHHGCNPDCGICSEGSGSVWSEVRGLQGSRILCKGNYSVSVTPDLSGDFFAFGNRVNYVVLILNWPS